MKVYELLATPDRWTKSYSARNAEGNPVRSDSPDAVCWCIIGALNKCYGTGSRGDEADRMRVAIGSDLLLSTWNDAHERTHAEVLAVVTRLGL